MDLFAREAKHINRFRVGKGSPGLRALMYKMMNKPYLDIRVYRGYREVTRIVTPDTGMSRFTIENVGTFILPTGEALDNQYHDKNALYVTYNLLSSAAGVPVDNQAWTAFIFPALSPAEFQIHLEAQTVADLLSESERDMSWLWYLVGAAIVIFGLLLFLNGGA